MTPTEGTARERRAADRERRRSGAEDTHAPEYEHDGPAALAGDALKAAASAAAVGAAVGAVRALSARRHHEEDDDEVEEREPEDVADEADEEPAEPDEEAEQPESRREPEPQPEREPEREREPDPEPTVEPASPSELQTIVRRARELLLELHGTDAEAVSSVTRTERGWAIGLEVVELRRIPDSTDILATYEVELDGDGGILRFERTHRYHRAEADREGRR